MTENKTTTYTFTYDDYKLLHSILPTSPCKKCSEFRACCGCSSGDKYNEKINSYINNGIFKIATALKTA